MSYPTPVFSDGTMAFGSRVETLYDAAGTQIGNFTCEDIRLTYPTKDVDRPNQVGEAGGFLMLKGQPTGTCNVQIPADAAAWVVVLGGYFVDQFPDIYKTHSGSPWNQQWVIKEITASYTQGAYRVYSVSLKMTTQGSYS